MVVNTLEFVINQINGFLWGWPLICYIALTGVAFSIAFRSIQFTHFFTAWRYLLYPELGNAHSISPLQAFLNALSSSLGNGSLVGMATALYSGGPGAAFWVFVICFLNMPIRFAEVFAGTSFVIKRPNGTLQGGPFAYITLVPGGRYLVYVYAFCALWLIFAGGCAMQCQSITTSLVSVTGVSPYAIASALLLFLIYIMSGGATRVLRAADLIVPLKVLLFFVVTLIALAYHAGQLVDALWLIMRSAFTAQALMGGIHGYSVQNAIRFGMSRVCNATEVGLGTAGILYGATGSTQPIRSGIMSMVSTFISNLCVCFTIMLLMVASGVWNNGMYGANMTIAAYETVFGAWGAIIVSTLSLMFGLGVLVSYVYLGRECWIFITGGSYLGLYMAAFCLCSFVGSLIKATMVWNLVDIGNAGLLMINLYALWMLLPLMCRALAEYRRVEKIL